MKFSSTSVSIPLALWEKGAKDVSHTAGMMGVGGQQDPAGPRRLQAPADEPGLCCGGGGLQATNMDSRREIRRGCFKEALRPFGCGMAVLVETRGQLAKLVR